jgi:5-methyltetrahydrofolate--homocysteine methyltransferase
MKNIIDDLKKGKILVADGAMGTSLDAAGLEPGSASEVWNILNSSAVSKVHKGFIAAGCDMIITNTFGANTIKLKRSHLDSKCEEINKAAVKIAKDAAGDSVYVLGDIGPTGGLLKPIGIYDEKQFYDSYFKQAAILYKAGVGAFIIETMGCLDELKMAVSACKAAGKLPVIASMYFSATSKGYRTMMGASPGQATERMLALKCEVIGANCGAGSGQIVEIMAEMREAAGKDALLIAQPNAGLPKLVDGKAVYDETPEQFAKAAVELKKLGVNIIGGCCGTTPEHIKAIVASLRGR